LSRPFKQILLYPHPASAAVQRLNPKMALTMRAASSKVVAPTRVSRSVVRPQAALKAQQKSGMAVIAAGVAMVAAAAPVSHEPLKHLAYV
jgi:hypothetical protein